MDAGRRRGRSITSHCRTGAQACRFGWRTSRSTSPCHVSSWSATACRSISAAWSAASPAYGSRWIRGYSCTGVPLTLSAMCSPPPEVSTRMATSSAAIGRFSSYCSACVQNAQRGGDHRADDDRSHAKRAVSLAHTIRHTRPHAHGSDSRRCALQRTCRSRASAARRVVRSDPEPHPLESTEGDRIRSRAVTRSVPATALALLTATCAAHRSLVSMPSPHRVSTNPSASTSPPYPLRADVP